MVSKYKYKDRIIVSDLVKIGIRKVDIARACEVSEPAISKWTYIPFNREQDIMKLVKNRVLLINKFFEDNQYKLI